MDQQKAGRLLKELRHEKQMTQEQLAQVFNVSSRSVSRWENGTNLPDISLLVEIADFYDVDVREIIEGERKSEMMDNEVREVATKMADYANEEKGKLLRSIQIISFVGVLVLLLSIVIQTAGKADKNEVNYGALFTTSVALIIIEILVCVLTLVDVLKCRITKTFVCALFANAFYGIANPLLLWLSLNIWAKRPEGSVMSRPYWNPAGFISFVVMGIFAQRIMRGKEKPGKAMSCFLPVIIAVVTTIVYIFTNPYVQRMPLPAVEIILKVSIRTALFGLYMYFNEKKDVL